MAKKEIQHIAFIMDGNGRWAKARGLSRTKGHKEGCERITDIYEECMAQKIKVMSVYAFSTENWNRPKQEINLLFRYLEQFFRREIKRLVKDGSQVRTSGDLTKLPIKTQKTIEKAKDLTKDCHNFILNVCLNYGGKQEIVRAAKLFAQDVKEGKKNIEDLDIENFNDYLWTKGLPPVDLLIRTSGELRTSNYMPYQLAYAEFVFPKTPWPAFTKEELRKCLDEYYGRDRRFGEIHEEQ